MGAACYALGLEAQVSKAALGVLVAEIDTMSLLSKRLANQPNITRSFLSQVGMAKPW